MSQARNHPPTQTPHTVDADCRPDDLDYRIVEAVAHAKGVDPLELNEHLYEVVDPDAVAKLFDTVGSGAGPVEGRVSFTLDRCEVTVHHDLSVDVRPPVDIAAD